MLTKQREEKKKQIKKQAACERSHELLCCIKGGMSDAADLSH